MPTQFDDDLTRLNERLLKMGAIAERMIRDITSVVMDRDTELLEKVSNSEEQMDALQNEIDEETVRLIAVHTPVAGNLRLLLGMTRINAELERIGDQVMNIAFYSKTLLAEESMQPPDAMPQLAEMAEDMLRKTLDAFTQKSGDLARSVIRSDDEADELHDSIFRELMARVCADTQSISRGLELVLIARALERIADHAVSIAEDVVYVAEGRNIRHVDDPNGVSQKD